MFVRVSRFENLPADEWAAGTEWFTADYLPVAREMGGFEGAFLLVNREQARVTTLTLWADEAAMRASEEAVQRIIAHNQAIGLAVPIVESFELAHSELPAAKPS